MKAFLRFMLRAAVYVGVFLLLVLVGDLIGGRVGRMVDSAALVLLLIAGGWVLYLWKRASEDRGEI